LGKRTFKKKRDKKSKKHEKKIDTSKKNEHGK
jgi:hypothetical protein